MDREKRFSLPAVGGSFLLVIFAVLCLTVFALLSLSTVRAGQRLGDVSAGAVENYYAADAEAEAILARLRSGEIPDGVERRGDIYAYTCPISGTQVLCVEVELKGTEYTVLRWQAVSVADWQPDDSLPVWDGD